MASSAYISLGVRLNTQSLNSQLKQMQQLGKSSPIQLTAQLPKNIEQGSLGVAQTELGKFSERVQEFKSVRAEMTTLTDAAGKQVDVIKRLKVEYIDLKGNLVTAKISIENIASKLRDGDKGFADLGKSADAAERKVANASQKHKDAIQPIIANIRQEIALYEQLKASGDWKGAEAQAAKVNGLKKSLQDAMGPLTGFRGAVSSLADHFVNAVKQTIVYTFTLGALRAAQQLMNEAIRYNIELNKEMIKIQVLQAEGAQTPREIQDLANSYNQLAKQMGVTTVEIAQGSVEWLRQGKTIEETTQLLMASTALSKLGNLSAAEATEYLTSTMNSFKLETEDAIKVVDKLIAVDNMSATSSKELATALRYSAATAAQAGVSLEQLISYIGTISSVTRINAESIGQSMKTIFTRMQDIKAGAIDEDGLGINNVAIALERVNISLMESETEFRDMSAVLEELSGKWSTLNEIEQANISKAIAGVRQQNMFNVLMQNMGQALELQTAQYTSAGLAANRYEIYLKGVEAAQNKYKASIEGLMQSKATTWMIKAFYDTAGGIIRFIDAIGGLRTALPLVIGLLIIFNMQFLQDTYGKAVKGVTAFIGGLRGLIPALKGANVQLGGMAVSTTVLTGGISLLLAILSMVFSLVASGTESFDLFGESIDNVAAKTEELKSTMDAYSSKISTLEELKSDYVELSNKIGKTNEETMRLVDIQNRLKQIAPEIAGEWDKIGNFIIDSAESIDMVIQAEKDFRDQTQETAKLVAYANSESDKQNIKDAEASRLKAENDYKAAVASRDAAQERYDLAKKTYDTAVALDMSMQTQSMYFNAMVQASTMLEGAEKSVKDTATAFDLATTKVRELSKAVIVYWANAGLGKKAIMDVFGDIAGILFPTDVEGSTSKTGPLSKESPFYNDEKINQLNQYQNKIQELAKVEKKIADGQLLTGEDLIFLNNANIKTYQDQNGMFKLVGSTVEDYNTKLKDEIRTKLILNGVDEELINKLWEERAGTTSLSDASSGLVNSITSLNSALQEQDETGEISVETANKLISTNQNLANALTATETGYKLNTVSAYDLIQAEFDKIMADYGLSSAAKLAADGMIEQARAAILAAQGMGEAQAQALALLDAYAGFFFPSGIAPSGGGGGGGGKSPEDIAREKAIEAKEKEIKTLEDKKKALEDELKLFKEYIAAQKEALKLAKEEADFQAEMSKKARDLAKLKARIAILSLDDSQEAMAERLKLEEEAAELSEEIEKDKADRTYDLQIQALDRVQKEFEDAIEKQKDAIEDLIAGIRTLIEEFRKLGEKLGSGGGPGIFSEWDAQAIDIIEKLKTEYSLTEQQVGLLKDKIQLWKDQGKSIEEAIRLAKEYARALGAQGTGFTWAYKTSGQKSGEQKAEDIGPQHFGGLIESHHEGNFAGNLMSNEVFAKLLKGEYVATEGQMDNFMRKTLPKMINYPIVKPNQSGSINLSMPITVEGNLDSTVIPEINRLANKVIKEINKTMLIRGNIRSTNQTIS